MDISNLTSRSLEIFKELVDAYIETGEAVGSRILSKRSQFTLSSATIRNIMADLEDAGLLYAPHTSAGRIPTEIGLRYFIDALLGVEDFENIKDKEVLELLESDNSKNTNDILEKATKVLSGLSSCACVVLSPKKDLILKRIEFILLNADQILVILISEDGEIENRIIPTRNINGENIKFTSEQLSQLSNYLSNKLEGRTISDGMKIIESEIAKERVMFDEVSAEILGQGIEVWKTFDSGWSLILKGHANLLERVEEIEELENIRNIFQEMEKKNAMQVLLENVSKAEGIQVFIGSENPYFKTSGCSLVLSPYKSADNRIVGALGVIGPINMQYRRVIPLVDYTSKILSKIINKKVR